MGPFQDLAQDGALITFAGRSLQEAQTAIRFLDGPASMARSSTTAVLTEHLGSKVWHLSSVALSAAEPRCEWSTTAWWTTRAFGWAQPRPRPNEPSATSHLVKLWLTASQVGVSDASDGAIRHSGQGPTAFGHGLFCWAEARPGPGRAASVWVAELRGLREAEACAAPRSNAASQVQLEQLPPDTTAARPKSTVHCRWGRGPASLRTSS